MLALVARILMRAHIPPGPSVESAFFDVRNVVGNEIVAERVAFIDRAPQLAGLGIDGDSATGITNSVGINLQLAIRGIANKNVGAIFLGGMSVGIVDVRS